MFNPLKKIYVYIFTFCHEITRKMINYAAHRVQKPNIRTIITITIIYY